MGRGRGWQGEIDCPVCGESISYSAWYDPGCASGPPENCYPPESDTDIEFHKDCLLTNAQEQAIIDAVQDEEGAISDDGGDDYPDSYNDMDICDRYYDGH